MHVCEMIVNVNAKCGGQYKGPHHTSHLPAAETLPGEGAYGVGGVCVWWLWLAVGGVLVRRENGWVPVEAADQTQRGDGLVALWVCESECESGCEGGCDSGCVRVGGCVRQVAAVCNMCWWYSACYRQGLQQWWPVAGSKSIHQQLQVGSGSSGPNLEIGKHICLLASVKEEKNDVCVCVYAMSIGLAWQTYMAV